MTVPDQDVSAVVFGLGFFGFKNDGNNKMDFFFGVCSRITTFGKTHGCTAKTERAE
jgi:hypothetical protein